VVKVGERPARQNELFRGSSREDPLENTEIGLYDVEYALHLHEVNFLVVEALFADKEIAFVVHKVQLHRGGHFKEEPLDDREFIAPLDRRRHEHFQLRPVDEALVEGGATVRFSVDLRTQERTCVNHLHFEVLVDSVACFDVKLTFKRLHDADLFDDGCLVFEALIEGPIEVPLANQIQMSEVASCNRFKQAEVAQGKHVLQTRGFLAFRFVQGT